MRLHHLSVTAFGPFAGTADIDLDELSSAGLFLLCGATGAGKTSVLDAVCFALYGDVPGDRSQARRLRCDQAAPGLAPQVTLELTVAGRRLRFVRSPAWERPKRRGSGTTTEPARVTLSERRDGEWQPLSSRIDEVGDLVARVVGMTLTQFTQVVLLPQGRFQAFLRARSEDRQRLLQRLFRTGRFADVETWLHDRRRELAARGRLHHEQVADLVSRASEAAGAELPAAWDLHDLVVPADDDELTAWVAARIEVAAEDTRAHAEAARAAAAHEEQVRHELEEARREAERREQVRRAREEHARLLDAAAAHDRDVAALRAARRADAVLPLHRVWHDADQAAARLRTRAEAATARLADEGHLHQGASHTAGGGDDEPRLAAVARRARERATVARAALPRRERHRELGRRTHALVEQREQRRAEVADLTARRDALPDRLARLRTAVEQAQLAADRLPALQTRRAELVARVEAHRDLARLSTLHAEAREAWTDARQVTLDRTEAWQSVQLARIEAMASELAGQLAVGASCPVCGSCDHPHRAAAVPGAPDATSERTARRQVDDARVAEQAHADRVQGLATQLAVARERTGGSTPEAAASELSEHAAALEAARVSAADVPGLVHALAACESARDDLATRLAAAVADLERLEAEHGVLCAELDAIALELDGLLDGAESLEHVIAQQQDLARRCEQALTATADALAADEAAATAWSRLASAATAAGFDDPEAARSAALEPDDLDSLAAAVAGHEQRLAAVTEVLRHHAVAGGQVLEHDPGLFDVAVLVPDEAPVDAETLEELALVHAAARDDLETAQVLARHARSRVDRLADLAARLDDALTAWAPVRAEHRTVARLAALADGTSPDNRLRMRLSAYVLAHRLTQVVAAANERLARMSDQRYRLEHSGRRGAGETRGGLSLLVRDDWSGEARDPATLSGGETFVVSLALALGLADVIAQEAGGVALETLFVDEGFGSLDADTLDDVMDTLDSLRDGGRVVGVVSHVAELRDRIPCQLVVSKARDGSSVAVRR